VIMTEMTPLPYSYCGQLDDVVPKYTDHYSTLDFFNLVLAKSLFFGGGLYINDGYLVNHPIAREQLLKDSSLLNVMLRHGFIRVFTRAATADQLKDMPRFMDEEQRNRSFTLLRKSEVWKVLEPRWFQLADNQFRRNAVAQWGPARNHKMFTKLMRRVLDKAPEDIGVRCTKDDLRNLSDAFFARSPECGSARHHFEMACEEVFRPDEHASQPTAIQSCMNVANQAYHYGFGMSLTQQHGLTAVDTTIGRAFDEFLETDEVETRKFDKFPLFGIPAQADFTQGDRFEALLVANSPQQQAKTSFMTTLLRCLTDNDLPTTKAIEMIEGAMQSYIGTLHTMLGIPENDFVSPDGDYRIHLAKTRGDAANTAAVGTDVAGLSVELSVDSRKAQTRIETLLRRCSLADDDGNPTLRFQAGHGGAADSLLDVVPQATSLAIQKDIAIDFLDDPWLFHDNQEDEEQAS